MIKKLLLLLVFILTLDAKSTLTELRFESGISLFGQIGFVDLRLEENFEDKTYKMTAKTTSIGIVKTLSSNRVDLYTSVGKVLNGVYRPLRFTIQITKTDYKKVIEYYFDYENDSVVKIKTKSRNESIFTYDIHTNSFKSINNLVTTTNRKEVKLFPNDYLSLYLNLQKGNLKVGRILYVDRNKKNDLFLLSSNLFEVHKNNGDDVYNIQMQNDEKSIFFKKIVSVGIAFYGDAYIEKISETTRTIK
ncbi:DUF3108 domain-containing protein [Sulfurimonas sp. SAG-AH-194-I05]|nr:DUF3108 domain-containing protein [Sulfurimonas sp. SAG-AH-194-I05]MDF1875612.1 DUF3108 domain-containing protein [Sulfurimonas sp. SAG-AH-194-I05]